MFGKGIGVTLQEVVPTAAGWRVTTRPAGSGDASLVRDLYLDVLTGSQVATLEPHQRTLLLMSAHQIEAELGRRYPDLTRLTVCVDEVAVGRLLLSSAGTHIRLVDLTLLPASRNQGIGTSLISELLSEAEAASYTMHAAVEKTNRAVRFLERLGFTQEIDRGDAWDMIWVSF